jgi:aerobic carbon-monoxide dehydrogenase large subunit
VTSAAARPFRLSGAGIRRLEDPRLLTGRGHYVADVHLPGAAHAVILRSPHAHAIVKSVELGEARSAPGVVGAISASDLGGNPRPIPMRLTPMDALAQALQFPLARDRVRYVGEPVAVVVAESRYEAEDALELVEVRYEPMEAATEAGSALRDDAPVLHPQVGSNLVTELRTGRGDVSAAFANADLIVSERFTIQRHGGVPLEARGLAAAWDEVAGRLTVWGPTKVPHFNRRVLADLLNLSENAIRFVEPDVGGGFGARGEFYPEDFLIPYLARETGRPVIWMEDRVEHLRATNHSRQQDHTAELAVDRDGRILGLRDEFLCDMGAYIRTHGATVPSLTAAMLPGPYRVPAYQCLARCVLTNKTPTGTYRGPGRFEATFVRERLLDIAAERLGLSPEDVRKRNFISPDEMPYDTGTAALSTPIIYDSGDYAALFERALSIFDLSGARRDQAAARADGRLVGVGLGCFVEKTGLGPWEYARVELEGDGTFSLYSGSASLGQGLETALAQICAEALGVQPEQVAVVHGDTDRVPRGNGAFASRGTVMAGSAAHLASVAMAHRIAERAANRLEAAAEDLEMVDGRVQVRGSPSRSISLAELSEQNLPTDGSLFSADGPLAEEAVFETSHMAYPYGVHLAVVEVDKETGRVELLRYLVAYDVGRAVNTTLVHGQLVGGAAQGIGGALLEDLAYDAEGQLLASSFMDYLLPTADDVPAIEVLLTEEAPSPLNPLGVKGAGEGGAIGPSAAVANAVADALSPLGVAITDLPLTPDRVRGLLGCSRP